MSVLFDSTKDERDLVSAQEFPMIFVNGTVREVNEEQKADDRRGASHQTKHDENPTPAL